MKYIEAFSLATKNEEGRYLTSFPYKLEMRCYSHTNVYPFNIFPQKLLERLDFEQITVIYFSDHKEFFIIRDRFFYGTPNLFPFGWIPFYQVFRVDTDVFYKP